MVVRAIAIWALLLAAAVLNGLARDALITPRVGDAVGHVISTILLCAAIFVVTWASIRWVGPDGTRQALLVGLLWLAMTVAFEFIAGHYLFASSWAKHLADYNVLQGRVWVLVLAANVVAPIWAAWARGV